VDADTAAMPGGETGRPAPAEWPRIADYWPEAGPGRPLRQPPALAPAPPRRPARGWAKPVIGTAVAVLLLAGTAVTGRRLREHPTAARPAPAAAPPAVGTTTDPAVGPATVLPEPSASASNRAPAPPTGPAATTPPPAGPAAGSFELAGDLTELSIGTARLDSGIARVTAAAGSGAVPKLRLTGTTARLTVSAQGDQATKVVVVLDERVVWTLRLGGGSRTTRVDLTGAAVARIELTGGAREIDLALPRLRSTVPVRMSGGVRTWRITTAGRVPVRLVTRRGAGRVEVYGDDRGGLGKGARVSTSDGSAGLLDLDAVAGIGSLTVDERR
jgi:hypothetical protein